jgi:hypothetical protein
MPVKPNLQRYLTEFDFRNSHREKLGVDDARRGTMLAPASARPGKRSTSTPRLAFKQRKLPQPVRDGSTIGRAILGRTGQSAVIPAGALRAAVEALPERLAQDGIVKEYGFGIVGFVSKRHKQGSVSPDRSSKEGSPTLGALPRPRAGRRLLAHTKTLDHAVLGDAVIALDEGIRGFPRCDQADAHLLRHRTFGSRESSRAIDRPL